MKPITMGMGQLKQQLAKDYQEAYLEVFEFGAKNQRIEIIGDKILFFSTHKRLYAIKVLDQRMRYFTRMSDVFMIDVFKERLREKLEERYGFEVISILQDYDPVVELSASVVVLSRDVASYLK